jgi:hypothetical protein
MRRDPSPFSHCSVGGVLMVRSGYKIWVKTEDSSLLICGHIDLWLHCVSHFIIFISNKSHIFIIPRKKSKLSLSIGLPVCTFNCPLGCLKSLIGFPLSIFGHCSWSPAFQPDYHKNHLIWVDLSLAVPLGLTLATAHGVQPSHLTTTRTISSEWTWALQSPLVWLWPLLM